jgi:ribosomal protein L11 methyltransferase
MPETRDRSNPATHYAVATALCDANESGPLEEWISRQIQATVLVEEGPVTRLIFARPKMTPIQWILFEEAARSLGCKAIDIQYFEKKDWQELWKEQGFKRFQVSGLTVLPAWDKDPADFPSIIIDPHLAFGTGWHETTHKCLEILATRRAKDPSFFHVMDFGSGTGILGISALRLHPQARLVAIDNDPFAVEATRENILLNQMEKQSVVFDSWEDWEKNWKPSVTAKGNGAGRPFTIIFANVTGGVVSSVANRLWDQLDFGGILIVSGVSEEERAIVEPILSRICDGLEIYPGVRYSTYGLTKESRNG